MEKDSIDALFLVIVFKKDGKDSDGKEYFSKPRMDINKKDFDLLSRFGRVKTPGLQPAALA